MRLDGWLTTVRREDTAAQAKVQSIEQIYWFSYRTTIPYSRNLVKRFKIAGAVG